MDRLGLRIDNRIFSSFEWEAWRCVWEKDFLYPWNILVCCNMFRGRFLAQRNMHLCYACSPGFGMCSYSCSGNAWRFS